MPPRDSTQTDLKDLLLKEQIVTLDHMNEILREHDKTKESILDIVLRLGKFNEKKLASMLASHYGFISVNPAVFMADRDLLNLIPKEKAESYLAIPITKLENTLTVAFANPTNLKIIDEIRILTGLRIKPAVAEVTVIRQFILKYYSLGGAESTSSAGLSSEQGGEQLDDLVKMIENEKAGENPQEAAELMKVAFETPVIKLVNMILIEGIKRHASDIFIEPWENFVRVRARVDGLLEEVIKAQKALASAIVSRIKIMSELNIAEHRVPQDGRFKIKINGREVDMRVSILPTTFGEKVCLRILDTKAQSHDISKLGFSEGEQQVIKDCSKKPHGMILVTGPTGSGKTTTLYSVLKYLDKPETNITTVEDPVEYQLPGINQVNVKEHIGLTFPAALRSILRQDPDIILIGEIRDSATLDIAIKAALTGHLVLSTLHTNDAASSITRMMNMGLEPFLIASTVLMISAQRLVRRLCPRCRYPEELSRDALRQMGIKTDKPMTFYKGKGCVQCRQTGYAGRSVITELLQISPEVRELIMANASVDNVKALAQEQGMTTLRECALRKALAGDTSLEEVFRVTTADQTGKKADKNKEPEAEDIAA